MARRFQDLERSMTTLGRRGPEAQYGLMANRGQSGGIRSISPEAKRDAFVNTQRGKFFDGRQVPEERVFRRTAQDTLDQQFMNRFTKPVTRSSNLLQMTADAPRSLAENRMALANRFGPTPREILGDMAFAGGSILQNLAEKGTPLMNLAKGAGQKVQNFLQPVLDSPFVQTGIGFFDNMAQRTRDFNARLMQLTPAQRRIYDQAIIVPGTTPDQAYNKAVGMAMGGIATLQ